MTSGNGHGIIWAGARAKVDKVRELMLADNGIQPSISSVEGHGQELVSTGKETHLSFGLSRLRKSRELSAYIFFKRIWL
jgi:hypothetical protein